MKFKLLDEPTIQSEYSDDHQTAMTIDVMADDAESTVLSDIWLVAGVPDYMLDTARAAGSNRGLESVWVSGDSPDCWCDPKAVETLGPLSTVADLICHDMREAVLAAHHARIGQ